MITKTLFIFLAIIGHQIAHANCTFEISPYWETDEGPGYVSPKVKSLSQSILKEKGYTLIDFNKKADFTLDYFSFNTKEKNGCFFMGKIINTVRVNFTDNASKDFWGDEVESSLCDGADNREEIHELEEDNFRKIINRIPNCPTYVGLVFSK
jgi:hypothetical protein